MGESGNATAANQNTANVSLASIDSKLPPTLSAAPVSDLGQEALAVRVISQLGAGSGGSTGGLTDSQLRASAVPVSLAGSISVTGSVSVSNFPATQPVSIASMPSTPVTGPLTDTQIRATPLPVSGTVAVSSAPTTAVTGPLTDSQLRATPVPVSGTLTANAGTGTMAVSAAALPLPSGAATETTLSALNTKVTAVNTGAVVLAAMAAANSSPTGVVSLGNSLGKSNVLKTGSLASSAVTADQVVLTYTVTAGKTFYLQYFDVVARLSTFAATATFFGTASLESPAGTKLYTTHVAGTGISAPPTDVQLSEPMPIAAGVVIRIVCTPSATTAFTWQANLCGYEK